METSLKEEVEAKIKDLREVLEEGTKEDIEAKTTALSESLQKVGEVMYKQAAPDADASASETPADSAKNVEEGEVVDEGK